MIKVKWSEMKRHVTWEGTCHLNEKTWCIIQRHIYDKDMYGWKCLGGPIYITGWLFYLRNEPSVHINRLMSVNKLMLVEDWFLFTCLTCMQIDFAERLILSSNITSWCLLRIDSSLHVWHVCKLILQKGWSFQGKLIFPSSWV